MRDLLGRPLRDLRISVTDRCNFRCTYCMPRDRFGADFAFVPRPELLTFEEITRVARVAAKLGARKIRLTGGEPLLRRDLDQLVGQLAAIPLIEDLALTTNGSLLARQAEKLRRAGLGRVTVSLDALDPEVFARMSDTAIPVDQVLQGIEAAVAAGLGPVKVNAVVRRGVNEQEILPLVLYGRERGVTVRFVEFMDVGGAEDWRAEGVVPAAEIRAVIEAEFPLDPVPPRYVGEVATRFRHRDGKGEIGIIASVSQPFCGDCTRARLSATGSVYTCLFASTGTDLRPLLRGGATDEDLAAVLTGVWQARRDRYSEERGRRSSGAVPVPMHEVGG